MDRDDHTKRMIKNVMKENDVNANESTASMNPVALKFRGLLKLHTRKPDP